MQHLLHLHQIVASATVLSLSARPSLQAGLGHENCWSPLYTHQPAAERGGRSRSLPAQLTWAHPRLPQKDTPTPDPSPSAWAPMIPRTSTILRASAPRRDSNLTSSYAARYSWLALMNRAPAGQQALFSVDEQHACWPARLRAEGERKATGRHAALLSLSRLWCCQKQALGPGLLPPAAAATQGAPPDGGCSTLPLGIVQHALYARSAWQRQGGQA